LEESNASIFRVELHGPEENKEEIKKIRSKPTENEAYIVLAHHQTAK
jgi:hypothetical protein